MGAGEWAPGPNDAITDVGGIRVGHWTDRRGGTGCTVILCEESTFAAADSRGGAPGTREVDTLRLANVDLTCQAILLTGGSAFGLGAADGVVNYLAEREIGMKTAARPVPIVPSAVIFDLGLGSAMAVPGPAEGYRAAKAAKRGKVATGTVGAGTGATVAKIGGPETMMKGGLGTSSLATADGLVVGALAVVNAIGVIQDPATGETVAGVRGDGGGWMALPEAVARRAEVLGAVAQNTTLAVVATNASLTHAQVQRVAYQAHNGLARTILPAHTLGDGDTTFAVAMGSHEAKPFDGFTVGLLATLAVEQAVLGAVRSATALHGVPSVGEWLGPG
jgi:L-aminopeptidase/D-esterase-like protein